MGRGDAHYGDIRQYSQGPRQHKDAKEGSKMTRHDGWPQFDETEPWHPAFLEDYGPSRDHPGGEYSTTGTGIGSSTRRPNMERTEQSCQHDDVHGAGDV